MSVNKSTLASPSRHPLPYIGRFAPSPSGPLHFGSLVSALASYLDAKAHHGKWLVRMEDIDPPREMAGAADRILHQLEQHGLYWDDQILYQSQRHEAYQSTLDTLTANNHCYPCQCSRQQLQRRGGKHNYPCRPTNLTLPSALRLSVPDHCIITFQDIFQGPQQQNLKQDVGDMVLYRKDGLFAYQLAVVVDDAFQQISHVIRGCDLLDSTPRQVYLQQRLGLPTPEYGHIPVATTPDGNKLSKQNLATAIDEKDAYNNLLGAIHWLGLPTPEQPGSASCQELLAWAVQHWQRSLISNVRERVAYS
jgi:glutamyl-Q tRNA(Asp) synthetase